MGSPLSVVVFGVSDLDETTAFYRDVIGLDATEETIWSGDDFDSLWQLPAGSSGRTRLFSLGDSPVGRILAIEFDAPNRELVAHPEERTFRPFWNINLYVDDLDPIIVHLKKNGCKIWSEPLDYYVTEDVGVWREAVAIGPDNITIVLLQLPKDTKTKVGEISLGSDTARTRHGFTQVASTSHSVKSYDKSFAFYRDVMGMVPIFEEVMADPALNKLNSRPEDGRTQWAFIKANEEYLGKVVISCPLNYTVPDRTKISVPPNIGYLAQGFMVPNLQNAVSVCTGSQVEAFSPQQTTDLPGIGQAQTLIVKNPGSDGLTLLMEVAD